MDGLLVIDKPAGITSRDAVNQVQSLLPRRTKIGHTGTLDPLATGVLVLCIGKATKLADRVQAMGKTYETRIRMGVTSTTDDADGILTEQVDVEPPKLHAIEMLLPKYTGTITQIPPQVSALKVGGNRAHDLVRRGKEFTLEARSVQVDSILLQNYEWPWLDLAIDCGKGTYIRGIARDLGSDLKVGGMVQTLRRTRVGPFAAERGLTLPTTRDRVESQLIPLERLASEYHLTDTP